MTTTKTNPLTSHGITGSILAIVRTFIWLLAKPRRRVPGKGNPRTGKTKTNLMAALSKEGCNIRHTDCARGKLAPGIPKSNFWASDPNGINQVGCVYTAQGFEFDYVGV